MEPLTDQYECQAVQVSTCGRCSVTVATSAEQAEALRSYWLRLRKSYGLASPDADPDFFLSIYRDLGKDILPYLVLVKIDDVPCAMLVGRTVTRPIGGIGFLQLNVPNLKCLEIVYGGLMMNGESSSRAALLDHLHTLLHSRAVDLFEVHHLDVDHPLANELVTGGRSFAKTCTTREVHWLLQMIDPKTGQRTEHNSSKTRSTFRRKDKRLVEAFGGDVELRTFLRPTEAEQFICGAASITAQTYQAVISAGVLDTPRWHAIIQALATHNRLRGYLLIAREQPIAYVAGALFDGHFTLMATSFTPLHRKLSPGIVLINRVIAELSAESVQVFDFGFGHADYKELLGSAKCEQLMLRSYGPGWRSSIGYCLEIITRMGSTAVRRGIRSLGAFDVAKRKWRRRLESQAGVGLGSS